MEVRQARRKQQIEKQTGKKWRLSENTIKIAEKFKKDYSRFALPLFLENHTTAVIYEEEVYSPIAACGLLKVYIFKDGIWSEYKSILIWLL